MSEVKTILGIGPVHIQREIDGETVKCIYELYISNEFDIVLDIINQGKKNPNGELLDYTRGLWVEFNAILVDPPEDFGGNDGDNHVNFMKIMNAYVAADRADQWLDFVYAHGPQSIVPFRCKFADPRISMRDISADFKGRGQALQFKIITKERLDLFPEIYSVPSATDPRGKNSSIIT